MSVQGTSARIQINHSARGRLAAALLSILAAMPSPAGAQPRAQGTLNIGVVVPPVCALSASGPATRGSPGSISTYCSATERTTWIEIVADATPTWRDADRRRRWGRAPMDAAWLAEDGMPHDYAFYFARGRNPRSIAVIINF